MNKILAMEAVIETLKKMPLDNGLVTDPISFGLEVMRQYEAKKKEIPAYINEKLVILPPRSSEILWHINEYFNEHGYAPSMREIEDDLYLFSSSVAYYHIEKLVAVGILEKDAHVARGIRLTWRK